MSEQACFVGVDAGGTKTRWCVVRGAEDVVIASGQAPAAQPSVAGVDAAVQVLADVLLQIESKFQPAAVVLGVAGAGSASKREQLLSGLAEAGVALRDSTYLGICGDPEIAAAAALREGPGVAAWSGTGSFAVARGLDGSLVRGGGRGYLLGDHGSGFAIVRAAAVAAVEAIDGLGPPTKLGEQLSESFGVMATADLGATLQSLTSRDVARRVPIVFEAAASGDAVAEQVIQAEVSEFVRLIRATMSRAGLAAEPVIVGGGMTEHIPGFVERIAECFETPVARVQVSAELGAARLARAWSQNEQPFVRWMPSR